MSQEKEALIQQLLTLTEELYEILAPSLSFDRLASDVTVAQLRVLLGLRSLGPSPMSSIAEAAGVVPSTATGIIDNLVAKDLVTRGTDPNDRRRVICALSPEGHALMESLWVTGRLQVTKLLAGMTVDQLQNACNGAEILRNNAVKLLSEPAPQK